MPKEFTVRLTEKISRTPTIESFRFAAGEKIDFLPGQFLQLCFDSADKTNSQLNKYLSFSSSPTHDYIEVTKRLSDSAFSGKLKGLQPGDEVLIRAPLGNITCTGDQPRIGFLIGGIGITPVISIIEYIVIRNLATDILLVYSNRTAEEIAFRAELDQWKKERDNFTLIYTLTDCEPQDPVCRQGRIDKELLTDIIKNYPDRTMFLFGPPGMVGAMQGLCDEVGCEKEKIKTENFTGY